MDLKLFETFRAVLEERTVVRAAGRLHVSQPTISKSLDALERSVGFALFVREGRRLTPTPEALSLYTEVSRAWRGLDNLPVIARTLRQPTRGRLVVGANPTLASGFVPRLIAIFLAEHPGVTIHLDCDNGRSLIQRGIAGLIDIGFATRNVRQGFSRAATIASIPVASGQMVCVLPSAHPLAARRFVSAGDIAPHPFVALTTAPEAREMIDSVFAEAGVSPTIVAEASTAPAACQLAATGLGLTLVGSLTAYTMSAVDRPRVAIRPFRPEVRYTAEYAISRHAEKTQLAETFAAIARDHGPAVMRALTGEANTDPPREGPPRKSRPRAKPPGRATAQ
ncbi:MAG: LysR family transcriptional regulator [Alphaproteobacteria bacterium]|nr:LysR family transcriptional regulator [Alphaproteobacteria bacterium]